MIAGVRTKMLSKATASDTKQLWLRSTRNRSHVASNSSFESSGLALTANDLTRLFCRYFHIYLIILLYCRDALDDNLRSFVMAICPHLFHLVLSFSSRSWAESGLHPLVLRKYPPAGCAERVQQSLDLS